MTDSFETLSEDENDAKKESEKNIQEELTEMSLTSRQKSACWGKLNKRKGELDIITTQYCSDDNNWNNKSSITKETKQIKCNKRW